MINTYNSKLYRSTQMMYNAACTERSLRDHLSITLSTAVTCKSDQLNASISLFPLTDTRTDTRTDGRTDGRKDGCHAADSSSFCRCHPQKNTGRVLKVTPRLLLIFQQCVQIIALFILTHPVQVIEVH